MLDMVMICSRLDPWSNRSVTQLDHPFDHHRLFGPKAQPAFYLNYINNNSTAHPKLLAAYTAFVKD
ncbi:hypothetical protein DLD14_11140 [Legionella anisa]|nr:hypothetical protein DLD14_11140 [Legionella anisa]